MKSPFGHANAPTGDYLIPPHRPLRGVRRSRWGLWTSSLLGVAGAVALITLTGTSGATADVPQSLQVGSQAAPTTVPTSTVPTTTVPTTTVPTTSVSTTSSLTTTVPSTTTTAPATALTIVRPKSQVTEDDGSGGTDDASSHHSGTKGVDN